MSLSALSNQLVPMRPHEVSDLQSTIRINGPEDARALERATEFIASARFWKDRSRRE